MPQDQAKPVKDAFLTEVEALWKSAWSHCGEEASQLVIGSQLARIAAALEYSNELKLMELRNR